MHLPVWPRTGRGKILIAGRLPEMVGGWGNPLMQKEVEFLILDGMYGTFFSLKTFTN